MKNNEIWRSYGTDYKNMTKRLLEQAGLGELLPEKPAVIAIKPNLVTPPRLRISEGRHIRSLLPV